MPVPQSLSSLISFTLRASLLCLSTLAVYSSAGAIVHTSVVDVDRTASGGAGDEGWSRGAGMGMGGLGQRDGSGASDGDVDGGSALQIVQKPRDVGYCGTWHDALDGRVMKEAIERVRTEREKFGRRYDRSVGRSINVIANGNATMQRRQKRSINFDIHFNVVAANMTVEGGWIPDFMIRDQVDYLNHMYAPSGIQFEHGSTTRILSNCWANEIGLPDTAARHTLLMSFVTLFKQGDMKTLNVHTTFLTDSPVRTLTTSTAGMTLGFSTPPSSSYLTPLKDGVFLRHDTLPGGPFQNFQGGVLVHEVGHWLGLLHTFEGGCGGGDGGGNVYNSGIDGDGVDDTPAQKDPTIGCPLEGEVKDSCPDQPGVDPVHNVMDFSDQECWEGFTRGQIERMWDMVDAYRS